MATNETYVPGQLYVINLNNLLPDPDQPRKYMDPAALTEMVESIKEHGIIQPPTFRVGEGGLLYIVTGERRCAAARMNVFISLLNNVRAGMSRYIWCAPS